jgi:hypothetical protein
MGKLAPKDSRQGGALEGGDSVKRVTVFWAVGR